MSKPPKNIFIHGPVPPEKIGESIAHHEAKTQIGAHSLFLGQVRADERDGRRVVAIEYTAEEAMALERMHAIREDAFAKHRLTCLHVTHSIGRVEAGKLCLLVFASAPHRAAATEACREIVERMKAELPIWGKEVFDDGGHRWKENTGYEPGA